MKVDYHLHTLYSDGIFTVKEVIDKALQENIEHISITDHDTVAGIQECRNYCKNKIQYITGIEITCSDFVFKEIKKPLSIHLLGYNFNEKDENLNRLLKIRAEKNKNCFLQLLDDLKKYNYTIKIEDIPISCGNILQLCDVLNYLKEITPYINEAVISHLNSYASLLTHANISLEDGIRAIHIAGGKAVWAHPFIGYHQLNKLILSKDAILYLINSLKEYKIDGIEAQYLDFSPEKQEWLFHIAKANNLFFTAGSDFHGLPGRCNMGIFQESTKELEHNFNKLENIG